MGKRKKLTAIEILLILAIIAILAVWLFPKFLKILDSNSPAIGTVKPYIGDSSGRGDLSKFPDLKNFNRTSYGLSDLKITGLGDCMMVLARRDAVANLAANLTRQYYQPRAEAPTILVCRPVAGSTVLMRDARWQRIRWNRFTAAIMRSSDPANDMT